MRTIGLLSKLIFILLILTIFVQACTSKEEEIASPSGKIIFLFDHQLDGFPLVKNELKYLNEAGNEYLITDVMYFISDITFYKSDGTSTVIDDWEDIFYIDDAIPSTMQIQFYDPIPAGSYDSIAFTYGFTAEKNQSFMFVNPPEVYMGWPEVLGGGYHYMMINGKWKDTTGLVQPFDFHLGIGQQYHGTGYNVDSIYAFVQNYFRVSLPGSGFTLADQETKTIALTMNIERWFSGPHVYNHNRWGGGIMQNQEAMQMAKENGHDVFSIKNYSTIN